MTKSKYIRTVIITLIFCGVIGTGIAAYLFFLNREPSTASARIEFTFDGASDSLAPNGIRFNPEEIRSEDNLAKALTNAGLDGKYTPEQLRASLTVSGVYPEDFLDQVKHFRSLLDFQSSSGNTFSSYHPSLFRIVLNNTFDSSITSASQNALLEAILTAYTASFAEKSGYNLDTKYYDDLFASTDLDFIKQLEFIEQEIERLVVYAREMAAKEPDLKIEGHGFDDIALRFQNLSDTLVAQLKSNLQVNGLAKKPQRLLTQYEYTLLDMRLQIEVKKQHLANLDNLIASFERNGNIYLTTDTNSTVLDGNSSQTYNQLINLRKKLTDDISNLTSQSAVYQKWINALSRDKQVVADSGLSESSTDVLPSLDDITEKTEAVEGISDSQIATFQAQVDTIHDVLNQIVADFKTFLTAYNEDNINPGTVSVSAIEYEAPSLFSFSFIKQAIKTSIPVCFLGFIFCLLILLPKMKQRFLH